MVSLLLVSASPVSAKNYDVTSLNDSGAGSLRDAILQANSHRGKDTITFRVDGTIALASRLPPITDSMGLAIDGRGRDVTISGGHAVQPMVVASGGRLELSRLAIAHGSNNALTPDGTDYAGAIGNRGTLIISECRLFDNAGYESGAIYNKGTLSISHSTLSGNSGAYGSGAIDNYGKLTLYDSSLSGNSGWAAGSVFSHSSAATLTVGRCTFSENFSRFNGGIANEGTAVVSNSTFNGNSSARGSGAISNGGSLALIHSTVAGNSGSPPFAFDAPGGISNSGTLYIANSLLSDNMYGDCRNVTKVIPTGLNWVGDGSCGFPVAGDPLLEALADNGGPTETMALQAGSGAIDSADDRICRASPAKGSDQRGIKRPQGTHCDIGAFEKAEVDFTGFLSPIGNPPELNEVPAGQVVPLSFQFQGNRRGAIFQFPYPQSKQIDCATDRFADPTAAPSDGKLKAFRNGYTFYWQTDPTWRGTCRQFQVLFSDGRFGQANFSFR